MPGSWLGHVEPLVFVVACSIFRTLSCGVGSIPGPGMKPGFPALAAQNLNYWTTKKVLRNSILIYYLVFNNYRMDNLIILDLYHFKLNLMDFKNLIRFIS